MVLHNQTNHMFQRLFNHTVLETLLLKYLSGAQVAKTYSKGSEFRSDFQTYRNYIKKKNQTFMLFKRITCPCQCGSTGWAFSHRLEGHGFNSQSRHMPGLQIGSQLGHKQKVTDGCLFLASMFLSLTSSLFKINKDVLG